MYFLALSIVAIVFMKEVINQYASNAKSFKQSEVPIAEYPTITICFLNKEVSYEYGSHFKIWYNEENIFPTWMGIDPNSEIRLVEVFSYFLENPCYILKNKSKATSHSFNIGVAFDGNMTIDKLPNIEVLMTSESNVDGVIFNEWMDGSELKFHFDKVSSVLCKLYLGSFLQTLMLML